jgi:hypothetical protein
VQVPIEYQYVDRPEKRRIELFFQNVQQTAVCLTADDWPNSAGKLDSMGGRVLLVVDDEIFPMENFNTGYCPKGCWLRVASGGEIDGFLTYKDFQLPERLVDAPKSLIFNPLGEECQ